MQAFGNQMDDKTLAEIITYIRHSWGNDEILHRRKQSVLVQPMDVKKVRAEHTAQ